MTRLCDELLIARLCEAGTRDSVAPDLAQWWRDTIGSSCERFEVTAVTDPLFSRLMDKDEDMGVEMDPAECHSLRLPYPVCWVEAKSHPLMHVGWSGNGRLGVLFTETAPEMAMGQWRVDAVMAADHPAAMHCAVECFHAVLTYYIADDGMPKNVEGWRFVRAPGGYDVAPILGVLWNALNRLTFRNVSSRLIHADPKVQKKRESKGRPPILSYREIIVKLDGQWRAVSEFSNNRRDLPLHERKGHYMHFTVDRPAFGRYTGKAERFWCPPGYVGGRKNGATATSAKDVM